MLYLKIIVMFTAVFYVGFCSAWKSKPHHDYNLSCDTEDCETFTVNGDEYCYCCDNEHYKCDNLGEPWKQLTGDIGPQEIPHDIWGVDQDPDHVCGKNIGKANFITDCGDNFKPVRQHMGHDSNDVTCTEGRGDTNHGHSWRCCNHSYQQKKTAYIKYVACKKIPQPTD